MTAEFKKRPSERDSAKLIFSLVLVDHFSISAILWNTSAKTNLLNRTMIADIMNDKFLMYENVKLSISPFCRSS